MDGKIVTISIVDYGLGNLFSIQRACEISGMEATLSDDPETLMKANAVLLPGVGAFGDAMAALKKRSLIGPLNDIAISGKPLIGICLGLQLLMTESHEFGSHPGLDIIPGTVELLPGGVLDGGSGGKLKVPHVGWRPVEFPNTGGWRNSFLEGIEEGTFMYFAHSYYVKPSNPEVVLCQTRYGDQVFCSAIHQGNIHAFQFHPERSALHGIRVFQNISKFLSNGSLQ